VILLINLSFYSSPIRGGAEGGRVEIYFINFKAMNFEKFTIKASESVQQAHDESLQNKNSTIDVIHLFKAMLEQSDGYIPLILKKL